jgi:hypothetical protein
MPLQHLAPIRHRLRFATAPLSETGVLGFNTAIVWNARTASSSGGAVWGFLECSPAHRGSVYCQRRGQMAAVSGLVLLLPTVSKDRDRAQQRVWRDF